MMIFIRKVFLLVYNEPGLTILLNEFCENAIVIVVPPL